MIETCETRKLRDAAREDLGQYAKARLEVQQLALRLSILRVKAEGVSPAMAGDKIQANIGEHKREAILADIADRSRELWYAIFAANELEASLRVKISKLPDELSRLVLVRFWIDGWPCAHIAAYYGYSDRHIKRVHAGALLVYAKENLAYGNEKGLHVTP